MQGILFDIKHFAVHDGPGIRTTAFFKGCPLRCLWCHNPEGLIQNIETIRVIQHIDGQPVPVDRPVGREWTDDELMQEIIRDLPFYEESGGGVTLSGGEPMDQADFLQAVLKRCAELSIHTCLDTCGYCSYADLERVLLYVRLFLYDLKIMNADEHQKMTGADNRIILDNLTLLHRNGAQVIIRFPLIPGVNDDESNIRAMIDFLLPLERFRQIDILPYHALAKSKYKKFRRDCHIDAVQDNAKERAVAVCRQLAEAGFQVSIGG